MRYAGKALVPALMTALASTSVLAGPRGGSVAAGSATISVPGPGRTQVDQTSDRVIVNWQGFSIDKGEVVQFNQPSSSAAALNRVTGADPSQILGQLSANGRILLINPNGILFGAGSRVDVAGLIATTANLADDDFMAKRLSFTAPGRPGASVVNRGTITVAEGGLVALVAPGVANEGVINARLGRVSLVSANRFTVDFAGDRLIQFAVDDKVVERAKAADGTPLSAAVTNSGRIAADGGVVQLSANVARGIVDRTIDMTGIVEARAVRQVGGKIRLEGGDGTVQVSGRLDASGRGAGQTGGRVTITGERVGLFAGSNVDASGDAGGGTVLVGGNRLGQGPERNAVATYVDREASIKADAVTSGAGGQVVVWSDIYTRFDGSISARGGAGGGNGGAVETSSKDVLSVGTGRVDAAAPAGMAGEWLLDPRNVTITTGTAGGAFAGGNPDVFTPTANSATVDATTISNSLTAGTSVTITTGATGAQSGNINFAADGSITKSGGGAATLTINAAGQMSVTGTPSITDTGAGGALSLDFTLGNAGTLPTIALTTGTFNLNSSGGHIFQNGPLTQSVGAGGAITIDMNVHGITLDQTTNRITGAVSIANGAGSDITLVNSTGLTLGTVNVVGAGTPIVLTTNGALTQTGAFTQVASGNTITINTGTGGGPITLTNAGNAFTGTLLLTTSGTNNAQITNTAATELGTSSIGGNLTVAGSGAITQVNGVTVGGTSSFSAGANAITLTNAANSFTGAVSLSNSGANNVQLRNGGATVLGTSSVGQNLSVTSGGGISQTGVLTVPGTLTLASTAASSDVALSGQANNITGTVTIGGTTANIRDLALRNVNAAAALAGLGSLSNLRNLTLQHDNGSLTVPTLTPTGSVSLTAGNTVTLGALTANAGSLTVSAATTSLSSAVVTGGAISITGGLALGGAASLRTTGSSASGANLTLAGAVTGGGQALTLNAGTGGDISLQTVGTAGTRLGALTISNARNVTASGLVAVSSLTQSAGSGTTSFNGAGLDASGAASLTTAAVSGTVNVGSFSVTTGSTVATGSIAGVSGVAAAALASAPGSTGTQTFNGCTIGTTCVAATPAPTPAPAATSASPTAAPASLLTVEAAVDATSVARQVLGAVNARSAPPQDSNSSNVQGFVVSVPTQNVDWSNPSGDLNVTLAPELLILDPFFHGGQASR